jgi:hypothetical protein
MKNIITFLPGLTSTILHAVIGDDIGKALVTFWNCFSLLYLWVPGLTSTILHAVIGDDIGKAMVTFWNCFSFQYLWGWGWGWGLRYDVELKNNFVFYNYVVY